MFFDEWSLQFLGSLFLFLTLRAPYGPSRSVESEQSAVLSLISGVCLWWAGWWSLSIDPSPEEKVLGKQDRVTAQRGPARASCSQRWCRGEEKLYHAVYISFELIHVFVWYSHYFVWKIMTPVTIQIILYRMSESEDIRGYECKFVYKWHVLWSDAEILTGFPRSLKTGKYQGIRFLGLEGSWKQ